MADSLVRNVRMTFALVCRYIKHYVRIVVWPDSERRLRRRRLSLLRRVSQRSPDTGD